MSWLTDLIKELRTLGIHREQIALLQFKLSETRTENSVLKAENAALKAENSTLQTRLEEAQTEIQQLKEHIGVVEREKNQLQAEAQKAREPQAEPLDNIKIAILVSLGKYQQLSVGELQDILGLSQTVVEHHLDVLNHDYVEPPSWHEMHQLYTLLPKGRKFLVDNGLA